MESEAKSKEKLMDGAENNIRNVKNEELRKKTDEGIESRKKKLSYESIRGNQ